MAEFEDQVQSQARRRDHRGLQVDAWITEFGAREKMKANEKAQDRTEENRNQEEDANILVVPIGRCTLDIVLP